MFKSSFPKLKYLIKRRSIKSEKGHELILTVLLLFFLTYYKDIVIISFCFDHQSIKSIFSFDLTPFSYN